VAIALQHANRKDFVNEFLGFRHTLQYNIGRLASRTAIRRGGWPSCQECKNSFCYDDIVDFEGSA
jgi:hypothetical protein